MKDYIKQQAEKGEVLEEVYGTQNIGGCCINQFNGTKVIGGTDNMVLMNNARVTINRGGKKYTLKGDRIEKKNGQWYVDGKAVDWDTIGGEYKPENVVSIEIHGNVNNLRTQMGDIKVIGDVQNLRTTSGNVECQSAFNILTTSGDVTCGPVGGGVSTTSGNINRG